MLYLSSTRRGFLGSLAACSLVSAADNWIELFDGHTLNGWRPSENKSSWRVEDGTLAANGPRSHLFYDGPVHGSDFRNFELEVELMARPDCNSGVYFHTRYQETGFPEKGFEIQVNNTARGEGDYRERKKTGSLYGLRNIYKQFVPDDQWFKMNASVRGKNVQVRVNGMLLVDYVEPTPPVIPAGGEKERFLDHGTFALQCHNNGSRAFYRSVRVRPLPNDTPMPAGEMAPVVDQTYRDIINIGRHNVPMVDCDVRLGNGVTLESALQKSRRDGLEYGIVMRGVKDEAAAQAFLRQMEHQPAFLGFYAQGHNWTQSFSRPTVEGFDYVISDLTDDTGRSTSNAQTYMDALVDQTVAAMNNQPVDIWATPTYLPPPLAAQREALWTEDRMKKVIAAAVQNQIAIELNDRYRLPSARFVQMAKEAGCKFCFGSGNSGPENLKRCEYGLQILTDCKLDWHNFFVRGAWGPRAVERKAGSLRT